ncbi:MAG: hypothetical protein LW832_06815 [Parachlamydia sp.]|jgi:hypothetical protein|nr:hypothetical protein [Parachlamydia sp.]
MNDLAVKFNPYIISNTNLPDVKTQLDSVFNNIGPVFSADKGFNELDDKGHVVSHPALNNWIFKKEREDLEFAAPDAHIYRVRRASRLQEVIAKNGIADIVVPRKWLYQTNDQWVVAAEKVDLDETHIVKSPSIMEHDKVQKHLSPAQAKGIATLCFEGRLEDVRGQNIQYTQDGKVALVDTEPLSRSFFKSIPSWVKHIPLFKSTFKFRIAMENSERLYLICPNPLAKKEIRQVQNQQFWKHLAKLVSSCALPLFGAAGALVAASGAPAIAMAGVGVAAASLYAFTQIGLAAFTFYQYHFLRSNAGHFQHGMLGG